MEYGFRKESQRNFGDEMKRILEMKDEVK